MSRLWFPCGVAHLAHSSFAEARDCTSFILGSASPVFSGSSWAQQKRSPPRFALRQITCY